MTQLKTRVAAEGLAKEIRVMASGCIDTCEEGCSVAIFPDGTLVGKVTEADVAPLVEALKVARGVADAAHFADRVIALPEPSGEGA